MREEEVVTVVIMRDSFLRFDEIVLDVLDCSRPRNNDIGITDNTWNSAQILHEEHFDM